MAHGNLLAEGKEILSRLKLHFIEMKGNKEKPFYVLPVYRILLKICKAFSFLKKTLQFTFEVSQLFNKIKLNDERVFLYCDCFAEIILLLLRDMRR